ncbi:hypothetical protein COH20_010671 [Aspergillus flavus]|uniref:Uncharacterized protein n=1 Tax=Aspergillus flavus TaxID=5059 RepID=A0AB74C676_ASPFL|nr:hypothetical protein COH20_010671 [Aspergillus flavus]RAQ65773.1 hypothetical protein COH21_005943 [Aspergillus flavus]RMZ42148.1 hypothetical protein CA14_010494 [Aspergillus flavus]GMG02004.1 unnamed protein product [Aspergillus oryzae]
MANNYDFYLGMAHVGVYTPDTRQELESENRPDLGTELFVKTVFPCCCQFKIEMRNVASFDKSKNGDNVDVNGNDNMDDNVEDNIDANIADNVDVSDDKSVELNYLFLFYGIGVLFSV